MDLFTAATASDDPLKALRELITFFFGGLDSAAELGAGRVNVQGWGEALVNPPLRETLQRVMTQYLTALTEIVRRAQERGQLDPELDPQVFGRILLSLYYGLELQKALDPAVKVTAYAAAVQALLTVASRSGSGEKVHPGHSQTIAKSNSIIRRQDDSDHHEDTLATSSG